VFSKQCFKAKTISTRRSNNMTSIPSLYKLEYSNIISAHLGLDILSNTNFPKMLFTWGRHFERDRRRRGGGGGGERAGILKLSI
uniref:Uncharacterized protein n=1 Tax=Sparus aurata TaxID=8175 RepID=A0A671URS2_SPAAU